MIEMKHHSEKAIDILDRITVRINAIVQYKCRERSPLECPRWREILGSCLNELYMRFLSFEAMLSQFAHYYSMAPCNRHRLSYYVKSTIKGS